MLNSNLLELLAKFTPSEMKELGEFASSPFFNKNENIIKLFEYIRKCYPDLENKKLEKETAFSKIFAKQKYNDGYMRTLMFRLQKLAEEYLSYSSYRKKEGALKINLLDELNSRKLEKAFLKTLNEQEKEFEESAYRGYDYFHYKIEFEEQKFIFYNWIRYKSKNHKDFSDESFFNSIDYIISAFLIRVLNKYRFLIAKGQYQIIDYDFGMLDSIIEFLKANDEHYKKNPVIKLHLNEILLMKTNDDGYYYKLKDMLVSERKALSQDERYSLHNILNQYSVKRIYEGEGKFKHERFELYKIALDENIYKGTSDLYFDEIMFGGMVMSAITAKDYGWAEDFMEKYKNELPPSSKNIATNFSMAKVSFAKKDYQNALKLLSKIRTISSIQYKTAIRDLTLMTYYELGMFSQAYFMTDSYRHFLAKNKNFYSITRYERMANFLKYFVKLTKLKESMNVNDFEELKMDIIKNSNIMERDWVMAKLKELEN